jgi:hypothetical protein
VGQIERLKRLNLSHVRADLRLDSAAPQDDYLRLVDQQAKLDVPLEIAVYCSGNHERELAQLAGWIRPDHRITRWIIFQSGQKTTPMRPLAAAKRILAPKTPAAQFGGGSDAYFTELNRERPNLADADFVCYSVNPQVHAFDNTSLVENARAIGYTAISARMLGNGRPVAVTPITLRPRFNPDATGGSGETGRCAMPDAVDPRQMSLFGAAWTLASIQALAESLAASATYYETVGWLGVMETDAGSPAPESFCSVAGGVFPLYHVFAAVGEFRDGEFLHCRCTRPLTIAALVLRAGRRMRILLANLIPERQDVILEGATGEFREIRLNDSNAMAAMQNPESLPPTAIGRALDPSGSRLALEPYEFAWLDRV